MICGSSLDLDLSCYRKALTAAHRHVRQVCLHEDTQGGALPFLPDVGAQRSRAVRPHSFRMVHWMFTETIQVLPDESIPYYEEKQPSYTNHAT